MHESEQYCCDKCEHWDSIESINIEQWQLNKSGGQDNAQQTSKEPQATTTSEEQRIK